MGKTAVIAIKALACLAASMALSHQASSLATAQTAHFLLVHVLFVIITDSHYLHWALNLKRLRLASDIKRQLGMVEVV